MAKKAVKTLEVRKIGGVESRTPKLASFEVVPGMGIRILPDHNTLWRFYRGHRQAMRKLFERTVRTAVTMKLVDLAVPGVRVKI